MENGYGLRLCGKKANRQGVIASRQVICDHTGSGRVDLRVPGHLVVYSATAYLLSRFVIQAMNILSILAARITTTHLLSRHITIRQIHVFMRPRTKELLINQSLVVGPR